MQPSLGVLTSEILRREQRARRLAIGETAKLAAGLLGSSDPRTRAGAASLLLELEQIDPLEPEVRRAADRVHDLDERSDEQPESAGTGDRTLHARVLLAAGWPEAAEREALALLAVDDGSLVARALATRARLARGRLAEAVQLWDTPAATGAPSALVELGMIWQASQVPERSSTGPQRIGHDAATSRRLGQVGLERAFRLASAGELALATEICDRVMAQSHAGDRGLYKLAALEKAWLLEASGRLDEAIVLLESLAREPDLTGDADRLSTLARLYEARPDGVAKAIQVHEHLLERTGDTVHLARLAKLHARAGDEASASRCRQRRAAAFGQEIGDVRLDQLARVAARWHVPLADLRRLRFDDDELAREERRLADRAAAGALRKRALVALLRGDHARARAMFAELARSGRAGDADRAYQGELDAEAGEPAQAARAVARLLRDESTVTTGAHVAAALLARTPPGAELAHLGEAALHPSAVEALRAALASAARTRPREPRIWSALARLERAAGSDAHADRHARRATWLARAAVGANPPGHALTAAVYHARGERKGIAHELWATRFRAGGTEAGRLDDAHVHANLADDLRAYLRGVFASAKVYSRARFGHLVEDIDAWGYGFQLTHEDEPSSGPSAGLAIAVSFLSLFLGRPVPADVAMSGVVVTEARDVVGVRRVGDADVKVVGALSRGLRRIVLPEGSRRDVEESDLVPLEATRRVAVFVRDLDEALEAIFGEEVRSW